VLDDPPPPPPQAEMTRDVAEMRAIFNELIRRRWKSMARGFKGVMSKRSHGQRS
jgi:hypothetical protein